MKGTKSVLVVEDDQAISESIRDLLEFEGYRVALAGNGKEALQYLTTGAPVGLILLDLFMPVMDGWEFLSELKRVNDSELVQPPIVITSAAGRAAEEVARDVDGYLKKPIELSSLLDTVSRFYTQQDAPTPSNY